MLGITDLYHILYNLGYNFDMTKINLKDDYVIIEIKGLFTRWQKLTPAQINLFNSMLSPVYRVKVIRKLYKWTIWEQEIIGGKLWI